MRILGCLLQYPNYLFGSAPENLGSATDSPPEEGTYSKASHYLASYPTLPWLGISPLEHPLYPHPRIYCGGVQDDAVAAGSTNFPHHQTSLQINSF